MAKGTFQVIFSGKIIEHADIEMVKANVGRVFSLSADRIEKLFSGKRLTLKKDIDQSTAERYRATLQRAGALCEIEQVPAIQTVEPAAAPAPASDSVPATNDTGISLADPGSQIGEQQEVNDANIDTGSMDMAEPGVTLVESQAVPEANIDTGNMDMADAGVTLIESQPIPDANIDTGDMAMAEAGVTLAEAEEFLDAEFDLSGLSLDEVGVTLIESEPIPDANIDTSQLSLD